MSEPTFGARRTRPGQIRTAEDLGAFMRARRQRLGYTQSDLAAAANCSVRFVSEVERGVAGGNIKQVLRLCALLGIDLFARER